MKVKGYKYWHLLVIAPLMLAGAPQSLPRLEPDRIVFANGKILQFELHERVVNADPEEALKRDEPVSVSQTPLIVPSWHRVVLVTEEALFEDSTSEIQFFDFDGHDLGSPNRFVGEALILERTRPVLLAQSSSHQEIHESLLLDTDGRILRRIPQRLGVYDFEHSSDDKLIWILARGVEEGSPERPVTFVHVVDSNGNVVRDLVSHNAEMLQL